MAKKIFLSIILGFILTFLSLVWQEDVGRNALRGWPWGFLFEVRPYLLEGGSSRFLGSRLFLDLIFWFWPAFGIWSLIFEIINRIEEKKK